MNRLEIQLIQQIRTPPCVTITLPTHRTTPDNQQDPIRVKNLVNQAIDRTATEFSKHEVEPLAVHLERLKEGIDYQAALDGLVLFANPDFARAVYLPFPLKERVVVGDAFYTRDLVFALNRTPRYWVLAFSEKPTRLYEGSREDLAEVRDGVFR